MNLSRRRFLGGLGATLAAPAIVRAASLMPVKVMPPLPPVDDVIGRFITPDDYRNLLGLAPIDLGVWDNESQAHLVRVERDPLIGQYAFSADRGYLFNAADAVRDLLIATGGPVCAVTIIGRA